MVDAHTHKSARVNNMKLVKYKHITYFEGYIYDGTHESAKFIIEKIKEHCESVFNKIIYTHNLIDDTIKFEYLGCKIEKGDFIELVHVSSTHKDIAIRTQSDIVRFNFQLHE